MHITTGQHAAPTNPALFSDHRSGSTHGQALTLIKHSVKSLLDTLGENDFVNIAHVSLR